MILLLASTITDYFCGLKMENTTVKFKKLYLLLSLTINLGMLFVFKYLTFFTSSVNDLFTFFGLEISDQETAGSYNFNKILLPIGISFYTFQTLSYTIDIYRGKIKPEKHFGIFALYVAFFPQLVAGPIERASRLIPQLKQKLQTNIINIKKGLILVAWGYFLKVVVADRLGVYVDMAFSDPDSPHGLSLILGAFFFCFQIYFDFSAYTSIAIGIAKIIGIELMQNFDRPFFAVTVRDFWQRWHISFMTWLKDYLYTSIGGSKGSRLKTLRNIFILFFIVGLWHGANWTFVLWGILNAILLILEIGTSSFRSKLFKKMGLKKRVIELIGWAFGVSYMVTTLVFFRSPSIEHAMIYLKNMFQFKSLHVNILGNYFELFLCLALIIAVQTVHYFKGNDKIYELVINQAKYKRWSLYLGYVFIIVLFAINRQNTFIYFQF
ncbi:MBOAT family O-acyltransferase [Seonamhaeicola sp.]|uniref:MBOAT family O-acyltransferase n=1 Tax=Seonamhaeicola sp. TaxID=1912245 RepID=UPI0026099C6D|nr:MBOAT family O-acyltransferase [Seonamhaeicola sp.]